MHMRERGYEYVTVSSFYSYSFFPVDDLLTLELQLCLLFKRFLVRDAGEGGGMLGRAG